MATQDVTAANIFTDARAALNDNDDAVYHDAVLMPYLNMALRELQEYFELHNAPVTQSQTGFISAIPAGTTIIGFSTTPALPADLIEIEQAWERNAGINPWAPMARQDYLPHYMEGAPTNAFIWWSWQQNQIEVLPSTSINDIKLDYVRTLFATF